MLDRLVLNRQSQGYCRSERDGGKCEPHLLLPFRANKLMRGH
jgi:hypothetical protein